MAPTTNAPSNPDDNMALLLYILVKSFRSLYATLIITSICSAMLIPLFGVLLFFSDSKLRRKPVFLGNVFAICLGISLAGVVLIWGVSNWPHRFLDY